MALLERVSALVRANLNDLIDRAEDPQKMLKQVTLDMQNQLLQVKTQVAIAIADEHLLRKKHQENLDKHAEWMRKAEIAVDKKQDDLARAAIDRAVVRIRTPSAATCVQTCRRRLPSSSPSSSCAWRTRYSCSCSSGVV